MESSPLDCRSFQGEGSLKTAWGRGSQGGRLARAQFWERQSGEVIGRCLKNLGHHPYGSSCACGQPALNFFHLLGASVSAKQLQDVAHDIIYRCWGGSSLWLNYYYCVLLDYLPLFLLFSLLWFALWNSGKTSEARTFLQTRGGEHRWEFCPWELLLLIILDFLHICSCHLWARTVSFLPSQSVCLSFPFPVLVR